MQELCSRATRRGVFMGARGEAIDGHAPHPEDRLFHSQSSPIAIAADEGFRE